MTAVGLLLVLRGRGALSARDDYEAARSDVGPALAIAQATGDETLELEATVLHAQAEVEAGDNEPRRGSSSARVAQERGRFDRVAEALRVRAALNWDETPPQSLPMIEEAAEVARVHGLVEGRAG